MRPLSAEEVRARAAMDVGHFQPRAVEPGTPAISTIDGSPAEGRAPAVAPQGVPAAVEVVAPTPAGKRRGRPPGKKNQPAQPPAAEAVALSPPTNRDPRGYTIAEMQEQDPAEVLQALSPMPDEMLFGDLLPYVMQMRTSTPTPAKAAEYVLQAQQFARAAGKMPPAIELLEAEQLLVLVYRLFPGDGNPQLDQYRADVVVELEKAMGLEEDEDDNGGEGDDES